MKTTALLLTFGATLMLGACQSHPTQSFATIQRVDVPNQLDYVAQESTDAHPAVEFDRVSPVQDAAATGPQVITQVRNLDVYPKAPHNEALLIKDTNFCLIAFTGYFQTAKVVEHWAVKNNEPVSATLTIERYANGGYLNPANSNMQDQTLQIEAVESTPLNHKDADKLVNFESLKGYFNTEDLTRCQS